MKMNRKHLIVVVAMFGFYFTSWPIHAWAQSVPTYTSIKNNFISFRPYLGGGFVSTDINNSGDFNGTEIILGSSSPEVDMVPAVGRNGGFMGLVGVRHGDYALEVSYWHSDQPVTFQSAQSSGVYQSLNVDLKRYFFTSLPTQPFLLLGVSFPWITFENASSPEPINPSETASATYSGFGFNLGAGLEIYTGSAFSIFGEVIQRWAEFNTVHFIFMISRGSIHFD